ncbi:MAG: hypothetical protein ACOY94_21420 [Bacillota bacterium]
MTEGAQYAIYGSAAAILLSIWALWREGPAGRAMGVISLVIAGGVFGFSLYIYA